MHRCPPDHHMRIYGINPTREALAAKTVSSIWVSDRRSPRLQPLLGLAAASGVSVEEVDREELDRLASGRAHQGIVAAVAKPIAFAPSDLARDSRAEPLLLVLDGVEDPQNFGAMVRTAEAAAVDGVVYQTRRAAPPGGAATRASAGAMAHMRLAPVVNIGRSVVELKAEGVWVVGLDAEATQVYHEVDYTLPTAVVVGSEGTGLRRLVRERCDWLVSIPMLGHVTSLNVSAAAAIVLYEAVRQRGVR